MPKFAGKVRAIFETATVDKTSKQAILITVDKTEFAHKMERAGVQFKDYDNDLLINAPDKIKFWVRKKDVSIDVEGDIPPVKSLKFPCDTLQRNVVKGQFGGSEETVV